MTLTYFTAEQNQHTTAQNFYVNPNPTLDPKINFPNNSLGNMQNA